MTLQVCAVTGCSLPARRACERCQHPCCHLHARWHRKEFVRGSWATFVFVCFACVPCIADEDDAPGRETGMGGARR
jgi:hypothetical protein